MPVLRRRLIRAIIFVIRVVLENWASEQNVDLMAGCHDASPDLLLDRPLPFIEVRFRQFRIDVDGLIEHVHLRIGSR